MSDDDRPAPEVAAPGAAGPVGTDPERAQQIADFNAARARYQTARAADEPDHKHKTINALDGAMRRLTMRMTSNRAEAESAPDLEFKLPEHLAAARSRVDATGESPDVEARIIADDRRKREAAARATEHEDPPPAAETEAGGAARRGHRASKKPAQPERTPEERNAAAGERAAADPVAVLEYAGGAGGAWLDSQLNRWDWNRLLPILDIRKSTTSDESVAACIAEAKAKTPEWHAFVVHYLILQERQGDYEKDDGCKDFGRELVAHLAALPEAPGGESRRSLLTALVERMPTPAEWDTRQYKNLPGLLANTRHVVPRQLSADDQTHLPFDWDTRRSELPPNKPRYEVPAWLPGWEPQPSKLISSPIVDLWDSGPSRGPTGPNPVPNRLGWEVLLAPAPGDYIGGVADVRVKLGDLALPIWPNTGRYKRTVHGPQLREGARWLNDPDNAVRWSADAQAPPTNLVLWYRTPTYPYNSDQEVGAYVTAPDGGRRRGAQIDNHQRRILAATSYRQHRVYVNACVLWDRYATVRGYLVQLTVPEVNRDPAEYVIDLDNKVAPEKDGSPSRRATHHLAVHTGKRLPNPAADTAYPWLEGEDSILVANHRVAGTPRGRNMQRGYTVKTLIELRSADKHRDSVLDFETRYRGEGVLSSTELEAMKEKEKKLPPARELEAVRLLPTTSHFAAYEARRVKAKQVARAKRG